MADDNLYTSEFLDVMGGLTHVIKYGEISSSSPSQCLFLVIPGNPGIVEYYEDFMKQLYCASGKQVPVWGLSHAGHVTSKDCSPPGLLELASAPSALVSLRGQVDHKVAFVRSCVPSHVKLVLVGHSIGCYLILHMLKELPAHQVLHCLLLFPTIERMATSPQGVIITPVLRWLRWLLIMVPYMLSYLSLKSKYWLIDLLVNRGWPDCARRATLHLFDPRVVHHLTYMAYQEMELVTDLDAEIIAAHLGKLSLYYGAEDHWCPQDYFRGLKQRFPHIDAQVCQVGYSHSFVLNNSPEMADVVWSIAKPHLHKLTD